MIALQQPNGLPARIVTLLNLNLTFKNRWKTIRLIRGVVRTSIFRWHGFYFLGFIALALLRGWQITANAGHSLSTG